MGLFDKLKSLLGLEEPPEESSDERRDVGITVEREGEARSSRPATGDGEPSAGAESGDGAGPGGSTSTSTAGGGVSASDAAATTGSESDTATAAGAAPTPDTDADSEGESDEPRVPSEAVDVIKGIGPTYAGRLSDAGIETVDDLAAADASEVAASADVPEGRLDDWIDRAKNRSR